MDLNSSDFAIFEIGTSGFFEIRNLNITNKTSTSDNDKYISNSS